MIDTVSKSIINQAFETLDRDLAERTAAAAEGREAVYQEASEGDYASAVAKDVVGGIFSTPWAKWVLGIVILVVIGLIVLLSLT